MTPELSLINRQTHPIAIHDIMSGLRRFLKSAAYDMTRQLPLSSTPLGPEMKIFCLISKAVRCRAVCLVILADLHQLPEIPKIFSTVLAGI